MTKAANRRLVLGLLALAAATTVARAASESTADKTRLAITVIKRRPRRRRTETAALT